MQEKFNLINKDVENKSKERLEVFYQDNLIVGDKKNYLSDHENSFGPFMACKGVNDKEVHYYLDAASQIATLGKGFSPNIFFGTAHHIESWLNLSHTDKFRELEKSYQAFLKRKLGWNDVFMRFCQSGAEANEIALGHCYQYRVHKEASQVLAFKGSFHGRMQLSLTSTWNPSKRALFEWKKFKSHYIEYPEIDTSEIYQEIEKDWLELWDQSASKNFSVPKSLIKNKDVQNEVDRLLEIKEAISSKKIFAILIEPMQCEGGDRYSTNRFHTALHLLARAYSIPIIYDEVQTGFHLGREFFWHKMFKLKDLNGKPLLPSYVVCAKKAQIGMVLSSCPMMFHNTFKDEFHVGSLIRGYIHALAIDQSSDEILELEKNAASKLQELYKRYSKHISRPRACGLSFAIDINKKELVSEIIAKRFHHGLLYYPAGDQTLRFRLNLAFKKEDVDFLFERLNDIFAEVFEKKETAHVNYDRRLPKNNLFEEHKKVLQMKSKNVLDITIDNFKKHFKDRHGYDLISIDGSNFSEHKNNIVQIQEKTYEPARQTSIEKFSETANETSSVCLALIHNQKIIAMSFAGKPSLYPFERGVRRDPYFDKETLYMLDTTVDSEYQGKGLGQELKYTLCALASKKGIKRINGRNRDHMAKSMLAINLSLGAYELFYIQEDYPDNEKHRDVIYYTSETDWPKPSLNLSTGLDSYHAEIYPSNEKIEKSLPSLVNKVCLSNFVNEKYLSALKDISQLVPESLRHLYATSGQSECVDKLVRSFWYTSKKKNTNTIVSFKGHYFGEGSFLSRGLSQVSESLFPVHIFENPNSSNEDQVLKEVSKFFSKNPTLACFIEPLTQRDLKQVSLDFLQRLKTICKKYNVPLVYNETASQAYHYDKEVFFVSQINELTPDAVMSYCGGQMGIVFLNENHYISKPLMMISTWDGDEFSLYQYHEQCQWILENFEEYQTIIENFEKKLKSILKNYPTEDLSLNCAFGSFKGNIPLSLQKIFKKHQGRYLVCPSVYQMKEFIEDYS